MLGPPNWWPWRAACRAKKFIPLKKITHQRETYLLEMLDIYLCNVIFKYTIIIYIIFTMDFDLTVDGKLLNENTTLDSILLLSFIIH